MRDVDSAVLRAVTQLSVLGGRLVRLLEDFSQQSPIEFKAPSAGAELGKAIRKDLLNARELQKELVAGHFALVRSMLRKQQNLWKTTMAESLDHTIPGEQKKTQGPRNLQCEPGLRESSREEQANGKPFTERQRQIVELVVLGYDNRQIGQSLGIAEQTVKNHLYTIFGKAGVSRRRDLMRQEYVRDGVERDLDSDFLSNETPTEASARRAAGD